MNDYHFEPEEEYKEEYKDLDTSWITNFEIIDKKYKELYIDDLNVIHIRYIYIDNNEIQSIKHQKKLLLIPNFLSKIELVEILKKNSFVNNIRYKVSSIIKYNINLEPENLDIFLKNSKNYNFLSTIKNIDEIKWEKSIKMFRELNELCILFYKNNDLEQHHNTTKKIYLFEKGKNTDRTININRNIKHNKTIRKCI
jgi:hypothetical protein